MPFTLIRENNLQDAFYSALAQVLSSGKEIIGKFNTQSKTKELHPACVEISDPTRRTLLCPRRGNNPYATLAETMWILAGRNDVGFLLPFMPRAADFSDDGKVWRAGYGPRIMEWYGYDGDYKKSNQLEFVIKQLMKDPQSRQAIVSIWDPGQENHIEKTKDYPCCNWIHFMIRDNALDINVVIRSNDIFWGWSQINMYEWSVIQEVIAKCLNVRIGTYYQMSDSFHIYEHHFEKANDVLDSAVGFNEFYDLPKFEFVNSDLTFDPIRLFNQYISECRKLCIDIESNKADEYSFKDLNIISKLLLDYKKDFDKHMVVMESIPFCDLKVACQYYFKKNVLREKEGGLPMIKECIEQMRS